MAVLSKVTTKLHKMKFKQMLIQFLKNISRLSKNNNNKKVKFKFYLKLCKMIKKMIFIKVKVQILRILSLIMIKKTRPNFRDHSKDFNNINL